MITVRTTLIAFISALALATPASGAQFYVDDNGPGPATPGCQDSGHPCSTINAALSASRAAAGTGDTINVALGTYAEDLVIDQPADNDLTIAGKTSLFSTSTVSLVSNSEEAVQLGNDGAPLNTNITLKDLRITVPTGSSALKKGLESWVVGGTLDNVSVSLVDAASTAAAVTLSTASGTTTANRLTITTKSASAGLGVVSGGTVNLTNAFVNHTGTGSGSNGMFFIGGTANVRNSLVRLPAASPAHGIIVTSNGAKLNLDSSMVQGGAIGIMTRQSSAGTVDTTVRRSTIDAGTAGTDDSPFTAFSVYAFTQTNDQAVANATVTESLLVDGVFAQASGSKGTPTTTCSNSFAPVVAAPHMTCDATGGNKAVAPSELFTDAPNRDYRLKAGSPAIDAGSAAGLAAGEPSTDQAGKPRLVDGDQNCVTRPDLGAHEFQAPANTPPAVTAQGATSGPPGQALDYSATGTDAEDAAETLTYAWAFSDGTAATGAAVQHTFATAGSHTATVTASDTHGCTATATLDVTIAQGAAVVDGQQQGGGGSGGGGGGGGTGADKVVPVLTKASLKRRTRTLRFTLSEAATVTATVRKRTCRRVAGKRRCSFKRKARLTLPGVAGSNKTVLALPKRVQGAGRYQLRLVARDAAGNASKPRTLRWRVR